jgi:serine/threonine-protein kinase
VSEGRTFGRYRIVAEIGRGAMGVVYRAVDPALDRMVAIKTIHLSDDLAERAEYEARFQQEAKAAARLSHPNIVTIYDIGREGDLVYMAMELLEGDELRARLERGRLPVREAVDIAAQVADALAYAHDFEVVHRDIKPANVMCLRGGAVKITDFGIARLRLSDVKTQTGMLLGSPRYMAPEQIAGRRVDARADLFSLGVVLYEMLTGAPPFAGEAMGAILYNVANTTPAAPSAANPEVPPMLDLVVAKALAKDPEGRYSHAREMAADLRACLARSGAATAARAGADATLRLDATQVAAQMAGAAPARSEPTAEAAVRYAISRRFDSAVALHRLSGAAPSTAARPQRLRRRRERLALIASVTIAALVAIAIAFG